MKKVFRPNAAAVVFRKDKKVLMCRRIFPKIDGWQFPQGGIEAGETAQEAALRELKEETSVHSVTAVKTLDYPLRYEFPEEVKAKFRTRGIFNDGQEQYWSLFYFTGQEDEINLKTEEPEFDEFGWFDLEEAPDLVWEIKREVYRQMAAAFVPLIKNYPAEKQNVASDGFSI